ncbi:MULTISPECIES: tRNA (N(6)-L-threonylcarbamoyladenosine(37)-C(2))-methylthiotransferase MtaB [Methylomonas]|uniref:tRNA (N(6)-L-threonylcarbamoyladenosine(37)-C(2))-methylthiotransferase MtaB n=2 Tax=Methylomonas TaxID=416 RepID=A0A140E5J0_9GAMM|nr:MULTISPECIES: tRNA (N(6)-L-threonylcarbamoyladenosine(37)-C(2))-methylthiotransferase MtaB [Methylomonas]AMK75664.1 tRNA (N(6)-L-threonylcarbamoyladenosine(37)-C(2))-methylthiotransferase MtaB [Methylomonas denitrificans]OAH96130.1 tRNA (N(6)-L-threonylcarbamoyladenosine(37)-C(2))-methylthiotransferase MtaB [Methylomonas methanica]TCV75275.1 threonylcarbamoyladenosine tRNA methylthiotransferase MtaB [Methylomonas methanica]
MQIHLKTLGCRLNEAELETWAQAFQAQGHSITRNLSDAQLVIINSCAVTQDAVKKSKQMIRRIHRDNPQAKLVVSGCYATLNEEEAAQLMGVDLIVSNSVKNQLVEKTLAELNLNSMPAMSTEPGEVSLFSRGRQRAFVKVQDGCRYRCTFCIVTVARGEEHSRPIQDVIDEINTLHSQGINEAIITGVHLGGYGSDISSNLVELITEILDKTDIPRLRLGSLEPWELPDGFFELFKNPRLMPHLHLPLQSGSDSVLRRMARRCKTEEFGQIVKLAREAIPNFNITTDIIVGFPGETEQEWQESFDYIKSLGFGHIHIFSYSPREGTKAASLPDQIDQNTKKQRSKELHELADTMKRRFIAENLGEQVKILWEGQKEPQSNGTIRYFGYTPNYLRVACDVAPDLILENRMVAGELIKAEQDFVLVRLI